MLDLRRSQASLHLSGKEQEIVGSSTARDATQTSDPGAVGSSEMG